MRDSEHAPRGPFCLIERLHGLAEIIKRGVGVRVERNCVTQPHLERGFITFSENASRHGNIFAHQWLGFSVALKFKKGRPVVADFYEGVFTFFAMKLNIPKIYISTHAQSLKPSKQGVRVRKIALGFENGVFRCAKTPLQSQIGLFHAQCVLVETCSG